MNRRLQTMKRLLTLYERVEAQREMEAQRTAATVRETRAAIGRQVALLNDARGDQRESIEIADRLRWSYAMKRQSLLSTTRKTLDQMLEERERHNAAARMRHAESRIGSERLRTLVEGMEKRFEIQEQRRLQAAADERFLSQQRFQRNEDAVSS